MLGRDLMRPALGCLLALFLLTAARASATPTMKAFGSLVMDIRSTLMAKPRLALTKAIKAERQAFLIGSEKDKHTAIATALLLQAEALLRLGQNDKARSLVEKAYNHTKKMQPNSKLLAEILMSRGGIDGQRKNAISALKDYQQAVRIFQEVKDYRSEALGLIYIASLYTYAKDHKTAIRYLAQAEDTYKSDPYIYLSIKNNRGIEYAALGRGADAEEQFVAALVIAKEMKSVLLESQILRNTAYAQLEQNDLISAKRTIVEAMNAAERADSQEIPATLSVAAQLAFQRGKINEARDLVERSFAGVDLAKTSMPMRQGHLTAYNVHRAVGNAETALRHLEALKRLDDESTKLATEAGTALMGARFDFANQELRIARLKAEELRQSIAFEQEQARTQRMVFAGAGAAALIVLGLLSFALFTIRRSRDAVRLANADLGVTNAALANALAAKTEFLATTSHEIRTPLNGILGMTEVMLSDRALAAEARDRLRLVHGAGEMMRALVDDLLDAAKIENGRLILESAPFDLAVILREAAMLWENQIRAKGVAFDVDIELRPTLILGDATRVRQVICNLLSNAVKFTDAGSVRLSANRDGDMVSISVRDSGVGVASDKLDYIFESFAQADASTTRRYGGTGLGLSISRELAHAMKGDLLVASEQGQGSLFTFHLPVADHLGDEFVAVRECAGDVLLVADRNPIMRSMFGALLSPHFERIIFAGTQDEAIIAIDAHSPRWMLLDESVLVDGTSRLAIVASACGAAVTVLCAPDSVLQNASLFRVIDKPVTGPELVRFMLPTTASDDHLEPLVSRAA